MPTPILATKLYIPPLRPKAVLRSRLIERLNEGLHGKRRRALPASVLGLSRLHAGSVQHDDRALPQCSWSQVERRWGQARPPVGVPLRHAVVRPLPLPGRLSQCICRQVALRPRTAANRLPGLSGRRHSPDAMVKSSSQTRLSEMWWQRWTRWASRRTRSSCAAPIMGTLWPDT